MTIPRSEHPDPQFQRKDWLNLNGEWDFEFDFGNSGLRAGVLEKEDKRPVLPREQALRH